MSDEPTIRPSETDDDAPAANGWLQELQMLDVATYAAIAATPTPVLDRVFRRLSEAADHGKLWVATAAVLAIVGGRRGRRSAVNGLAAQLVTSAVVNLALKPLGDRRRPDRDLHQVPLVRQVSMPASTSFPSGHAASAAAFTTGAAAAFPEAGVPLGVAAAAVSYSRVHTGVHYPIDVIAGSLAGATLAPLVVALIDRGRKRGAVARLATRRSR